MESTPHASSTQPSSSNAQSVASFAAKLHKPTGDIG